jgi:eukaryotic-like serine/threonine-protein kinase
VCLPDVCDEIAEFGEEVVSLTERDTEVLESVLLALVEMGHRHNRWFVRDTVTRILQRATSEEDELVAVNALRDCSQESVKWSITNFAAQSMHPILRSYLSDTHQAREA